MGWARKILRINLTNGTIKTEPLNMDWAAKYLGQRGLATKYFVEEVDPKQSFFENDFTGAKFIWTEDIALDNTVIFRTKVEKPGWTPRWNTKPDLNVIEAPLK